MEREKQKQMEREKGKGNHEEIVKSPQKQELKMVKNALKEMVNIYSIFVFKNKKNIFIKKETLNNNIY